jgi:hypothetical protein
MEFHEALAAYLRCCEIVDGVKEVQRSRGTKAISRFWIWRTAAREFSGERRFGIGWCWRERRNFHRERRIGVEFWRIADSEG